MLWVQGARGGGVPPSKDGPANGDGSPPAVGIA